MILLLGCCLLYCVERNLSRDLSPKWSNRTSATARKDIGIGKEVKAAENETEKERYAPSSRTGKQYTMDNHSIDFEQYYNKEEDGEVDQNQNKSEKFISYRVVRGLQLNQTFVEDYTNCEDFGRFMNESFAKPGLLDFHTQVDTNLNILFVGSSVGMQFSQGFQEATKSIKRKVIRYAMRTIRFAWKGMHENTHISLTKDGGTVGMLRTTGILLNKTRDVAGAVAPRGGGGWFTSDVRELKRMGHSWKTIESLIGYAPNQSPCETNEGNQNFAASNETNSTLVQSCEEKDFDVVVHQIPVRISIYIYSLSCSNDTVRITKTHQGTILYLFSSLLKVEWRGNKLLRLELDEMLDLSFDDFGANTVILMTIPINNNIASMDDVIPLNKLIWDAARDFQRNQKKSNNSLSGNAQKKQVFVMDLFAYSVSLFLHNSMDIGLFPTDEGKKLARQMEQEQKDFNTYLNLTKTLNDAVKLRSNQKSVGQVCGDMACQTSSRTSYDGMHWCMKETSGRLNAALACLLKCSLNHVDDMAVGTTTKAMSDVNSTSTGVGCETKCNEQFMSLKRVPWEAATEVNVKMSGLENY